MKQKNILVLTAVTCAVIGTGSSPREKARALPRLQRGCAPYLHGKRLLLYEKFDPNPYQSHDLPLQLPALLRRGEMEEEDCSVATLFEQSQKAMYVKAAEKKIHLSYAQSQGFFIRGNMEQLLIMLNNLIDNAMKASQSKGRICVS